MTDPIIKDIPRRWSRFERSSDAYLTVVIILLALIIIPIITSGFRAEDVLTALLVGAAVTLSMAASKAPRIAIHLSWVATGVIVLSTLFRGPERGEIAATGGIVLAILMIATPVMILRRIAKHETVTATTIWGAVAAYLAFGVAFSLMYATIFFLDPEAFNGVVEGELGDMNYFSFVTQTTLGYGDISPAGDLPRALVVFQTLIGQIYLVIVVARVVSLLGKPNQYLRPEKNGPATD